METIIQSKHDAIDKAELAMVQNFDPVDCPLKHTFTPGMYAREITMPAGTLLTSKIHKTEHQFIVSEGVLSVFNAENNETIQIEAPYHGVTKPGTRRVIFIFEDTIWTTFHPLPFIVGNETEKDVEWIEDILIEQRQNMLLVNKDKEGIECHF